MKYQGCSFRLSVFIMVKHQIEGAPTGSEALKGRHLTLPCLLHPFCPFHCDPLYPQISRCGSWRQRPTPMDSRRAARWMTHSGDRPAHAVSTTSTSVPRSGPPITWISAGVCFGASPLASCAHVYFIPLKHFPCT